MTQGEYNRAFHHGLIFGAVLAFSVTLAAAWSLQPTPEELRQRCVEISH